MEQKEFNRDQLRNIINNYIIFSSQKDMGMEKYLDWVFQNDKYLKEIGKYQPERLSEKTPKGEAIV